MARLSRAEIFDPSEIVAVHTIERTVRRCYLLGDDHLTQKNFDHRKKWFEDKLKQLASNFGIDLLEPSRDTTKIGTYRRWGGTPCHLGTHGGQHPLQPM